MVQGCCRKKVSDRLSGREMGTILPRRWNTILQIIGDCQDLAETWNENCRTVFLTIYFGLLFQNPFQAESRRQLLGHPGDRQGLGQGVIMEIKRAANEKENLADLVAEGLGQIEKNKYDVRLVSDPSLSVVLHWSLAFFKKSCQARAIVVKADIPPLGEGEARSQPPQGIRAGT